MWFSSLMKGFSSQSLIRALRSLTVYSPSYSTVASVRPHKQLLTKHGLSILSQLLGCSDIHHCCDQKAPEHYQRAQRGKSFFPKWMRRKSPEQAAGLPVFLYAFRHSLVTPGRSQSSEPLDLLAHDPCAVQFWRFHRLHLIFACDILHCQQESSVYVTWSNKSNPDFSGMWNPIYSQWYLIELII